MGAIWKAEDANFLHADNEDSDQTVMRRLIRVFVGRTCPKVRFLVLRRNELLGSVKVLIQTFCITIDSARTGPPKEHSRQGTFTRQYNV